MPPTHRVLVAMSGGVDSSVTAYLLKEQGYECVGATMRLYDGCTAGRGADDPCANVADIDDAARVAARLGIPHEVIDFRPQFERNVIEDFVAAYEHGLTPNPCVTCNRRVKFGALLERALELGCDAIATGHYARIDRDERGCWRLRLAEDAAKDQTYFLYSLTQERLARTIFPLGGLVKERDVRRIAAEQGFSTASKSDSQGICFVPDNDFATFIERRRGSELPAGDIVDAAGNVLGRHRGALRYTVGQRRGLGVASARPLYVSRVDIAANTVTLGPEQDLFAEALVARDWIWSAPADAIEQRVRDGMRADGSGLEVGAKIRYRQAMQAARIALVDGESAAGGIRIEFDEPQRAIAPGQAVVVYEGNTVLGGGTVEAAE